MTRLNLSGLASISEITAAILVVVSLAFIYQELEQNTRSTQDSSYQQFLSNLTELELAEASDLELSRISLTAETNPEELSEEEWFRFTKIAGPRLAQMEYAYLSKSNGTMSDLYWQAVVPHMGYLFCLAGYRKFMDSGMDQIYATNFLEFLEREIYPKCGKPSGL